MQSGFAGDQSMRKSVIIIVNVVIVVAILIFVVLYSGSENRNSYQRQIEHFEDTTVTMEHVTENYLEGEQRICDIWARYINDNDMTMEEAFEKGINDSIIHVDFMIGADDLSIDGVRPDGTVVPVFRNGTWA